jgi:GR25 family glycosyltransferase involved in LPS biosynthesis
MFIIQNESLRTSHEEINLNQFLNSQLPFLFDSYKCSNSEYLEFIKCFVRNNIYIKEKWLSSDFKFINKEGDYFIYERNKIVKVGFEYFWNEYLTVPERPFVYHLLSLIDGSLYENNIQNCDVIYHSHFMNNPFQNYLPQKKYIFFSGEKYKFPIEKYHLSLSSIPDSNHSVCYPFFFTVHHTYKDRYHFISEENTSTNIPEDFCAFIISNPNCQIRNLFFEYLDKNYKHVKSYGKVLNNVGYTLNFPYNDEKQLELLGKHKFVICFENTKTDDYYITEKLLLAKASGCIPIYWGTRKCLEIFDANSFLYLQNETIEGFKALMNKIILIDKSKELFLKIRNTPLLKSEFRYKFQKSFMKEKINHILFQSNQHPYLQSCPKIFYINMNRSQDRNQRMIKLFHEHGITNYERVEAVDGDKIPHLEQRLTVHEEATTMSHLKAVEQFYDSGLESAIICEDDISLEWIHLWKKPLHQIINEMPKDGEILQLGYTLYPHNFHHIKQDYNPFILVTFNGAMAYYITRIGAEKILLHHTWKNPRLYNYHKIRPVSDVVIFDLAKTYTYKYCLITYPDDNKSTIHDYHLSIHINSKICARKVFDIL